MQQSPKSPGDFRREDDRSPPVIPDHQLMRRIGRGAYGEVWLAQNILGTFRAVKIVYRDRFADARPYEREFQGIQKYEPVSRASEGLLHLLQVGRNDEGGYFYYVMEPADDVRDLPIVPGNEAIAGPSGPKAVTAATYTPKSLRALLERRFRLPAQECVEIVISLCTALERLHKSGLIHRDIKSSNIIFVNGLPKLADIGSVSRLDEPLSFVGTAGFVPPEGPGTVRGDIYSLGKVLYEMATGKDRLQFPEPLTDLMDDPANRALFRELNEVILKACHPSPSERYASANEMRNELLLLQSGTSLKRLRMVQKRRSLYAKLAVVVSLILLLGGAIFVRERRTAQTLKRLALENRERLIRLHVSAGDRHLEYGDFSSALVWFTAALGMTETDPDAEPAHRFRAEALSQLLPRLTAMGVHEEQVETADINAAEDFIVTGSADGMARVWNLQTGEPVTPPLEHGAVVRAVAFSPSGDRILTASGTVLQIRTTRTGEVIHALSHEELVTHAVFSPDGSLVAAAGVGGKVSVWKLEPEPVLIATLPHAQRVRRVAFHPAGDRLATACDDGTARIWPLEPVPEAVPPMPHESGVRGLVWSPTGDRLVTITSNGEVRIWNPAKASLAIPPLQHIGEMRSAAFSPDGRLIVTGGDSSNRTGQARVWEAATGKPLTPPFQFAQAVREVCFSPDGRWILAACDDGYASVWNIQTGRPVYSKLGHGRPVFGARFCAGGRRVITVGEDGTWRAWELGFIPGPDLVAVRRSVSNAEFSPQGQSVLISGEDEPATLHDVETRRSILLSVEGERAAGNAVFGPDGRVAFATGRFVNIRRREADGELEQRLEHPHPAGAIAFSRDSRYLAVGQNGFVRIWHLGARNPSRVDSGPIRWAIRHLAFSPDGRRLVVSSGNLAAAGEGEAHVLDTATGREHYSLKHAGAVVHADFSPDGARFVTACSDYSPGARSAHVWETTTGRELIPPLRHDDGVYHASFSPDGRWIITGSEDDTARIWDSFSGKRRCPPLEHRRTVHFTAFCPDGRCVATASGDGTCRIWDAASGAPITPPLIHPGRVFRVTFSKDGRQLLTACDDVRTGKGQPATSAVFLWRFPRLGFSVADLVTEAELAAGAAIDHTGDLVPFEGEELQERLSGWRKMHPERFAPSQAQIYSWHEQQAMEAELAGHEPAVLFHLAECDRIDPARGGRVERRSQKADNVGLEDSKTESGNATENRQ